MVLSNDSMGDELESTLKKHAHELVDCLERGHFQQAVQLTQELSQAGDRGLYQEASKLTRELHNTIVSFQIDPHFPHAQEVSQIADAIDHLSYVVEMAEKAANRTMDLVEQSTPLVNQLGDNSREPYQKRQRFIRREVDADGFRELAKRIEQLLVRSGENASQLSSQPNDILLVRDYQDLTDQVIKRVTRLVTRTESSLAKLVWVVGQVDRYTGIEHGHVSMRHQAALERSTKGKRPQVTAKKREDVVSGQDGVDDLLSSLGFWPTRLKTVISLPSSKH